MKIWLDDIRPAPERFTHVKTLLDLKNLLEKNDEEIEVFSFDHDLGENEPDGYEIVKWLANNYLDRWPAKVVVHSSNPPGSANIRAFDDFVRTRLLSQ